MAYLDAQRGALRDYVDRVAAVGDYHVYARAVAQLLAEHRDRVVEDRRRVERVDAVPWGFCRVHRASVEGDVVALEVDELRHQRRGLHRVRHHSDVDVFEAAGLEHSGLAAPRLLGGRAEQIDAALVSRLHEPFGEHRRRAVAHRADEVVPAGVAEAWQSVVLGAYPYARPFAVGFVRDEGGRQPFDILFDLEAFFFKELDEFRLRPEFFHLYLGVGVEEFLKLEYRSFFLFQNFPDGFHIFPPLLIFRTGRSLS